MVVPLRSHSASTAAWLTRALATTDMSQKVYRRIVGETKALWTFSYVALSFRALSLFKQAFRWSVFTRCTSFQTSFPCSSPQLTCVWSFREAPPKNVVLHAREKRKTAPVEACVFFVNEQVYACAGTVDSSVLTRQRLDAPPAQALRGHPEPAPYHLVAGIIRIARRRSERGESIIETYLH